ncbi:MAG: ArsR family transcriptional regulator [Chloroflexi bacterium HGW-Chloroflexi-10]|nr:MAG: ArsR family transcriptional regulator [Chloroflexi bacterium HGW-Chloroflexi-10]
MEQSSFSNLARWLKVVYEPKRLLLLEKIIEGVQCNCELGDALQMAPNLTSHHLGVLRESGLVDAVRDPNDARWIYYSINLAAMEELKQVFSDFFNAERIQPRRLTCGPQTAAERHADLLNLEK